ncbi:MAG: hypothetical protein AAFQ35_14530, partial [Pseudomonadota bacterium]
AVERPPIATAYPIRRAGNPLAANVDMIDWIEQIHIKETREYVKKVMANLQMYRHRLGAPETALRITSDLARGAR